MADVELENLYRRKIRRAAGVMLGWCAVVLAAAPALDGTRDEGIVLGGIAIVAGLVALLLARRLMRMPCPACGTNLYRPLRAATRRGSRLAACPRCWEAFH